MNRVIFLILLPILFTSCGVVGDEPLVEIDPGEIVLQTDQISYSAEQDPNEDLPTFRFTLINQFENRSGRVLYLATCNPNSVHPIYNILLMDQESSSISGYRGIENCAGRQDPIIINAGNVRRDTLQITGPFTWDNETGEPLGVLEGKYRLVYETLTCPAGDRCVIPDSLSWSNEFEVTLIE